MAIFSMKKLISAIMLIIFIGAYCNTPLHAVPGESYIRVQTPGEDGQADVVAAAMGWVKFTKVPDPFVNAQAAGEAEKAAQELLAWAQWELSDNTEPNPYTPPVWGENLTPEVGIELGRFRETNDAAVRTIMFEGIRSCANIDAKSEEWQLLRKCLTYEDKLWPDVEQLKADKGLLSRVMDVAKIYYKTGLPILYEADLYITSLNRVDYTNDLFDYYLGVMQIAQLYIMIDEYETREEGLSLIREVASIQKMSSALGNLMNGRPDLAIALYQEVLELKPDCATQIARFLVELALDELEHAQDCCHAAWALKDQGVWAEFEKAIATRGGKIEADERGSAGITFTITQPAPEVKEQEVKVNAVGVRAREQAL